MTDRNESHPGRILRVGLTGGIATGKSVVAEVFRERGAFVVDADHLGHELMEPGTPAHAEIRALFGDEILLGDAHIDRKKLGARIFSDDQARAQLNRILHPRIMDEAERRFARHEKTHPGGIAVLQAALLAEAGAGSKFDRIVLTECDPRVRLARLMDRDRIGEAEALRRIAAQTDAASRRSIAQVIVDTSGSLPETQARARQAFDILKRQWEASRDAEESR